MKGRHIANNIRLVLDILDYKELINDKAVILFVDFYKAFIQSNTSLCLNLCVGLVLVILSLK